MNEIEFLKHYISNASQIMWFLGAGTSRTSGMPTATDIVWDLKIRLYCLEENQDIKNHDSNKDTVRRKIQDYFDSRGYPPPLHNDEYSFYFYKTFGTDYAAQQRYLSEKLSSDKISLNAGHKILAGLIALEKAKLVFTSNFDEVIETAYAKISGMTLPTFHLEGSYAALEALNQERFPIYAKVHGDFKYQSVKNLSADLLNNDRQIQNCFLAATSRYGLVVSGYSGRDTNVMEMFEKAIKLHNAFPSGLFWTVTDQYFVSPSVSALIREAQKLGVNAHIIESGTFDIMLSKMWRSLPGRPDNIVQKVNANNYKVVSIALPPAGNGFPIIRTNVLPIVSLPTRCALIKTKRNFSYREIKELLRNKKPFAVISKMDQILAWGDIEEFKRIFEEEIETIEDYQFEAAVQLIKNSTLFQAFFERGLIHAICRNDHLQLKNNRGFYVVINLKSVNENIFIPLKGALTNSFTGLAGQIAGSFPNGTSWQEAVKLKFELKNDKPWLIITPTIWIEPASERQNHIDFIKQRNLKRYNKVTSALLDAWIKILFGEGSKAASVKLFCYQEASYPVEFTVNTRSAYSRK